MAILLLNPLHFFSEINEVTNFAEMDWQDFEYLVKELFKYDIL